MGISIRHRRWLLPSPDAPFIEGVLLHDSARAATTVEIAGGTPQAVATVHVGGIEVARRGLDACGSASVELPAAANPLDNVQVLVGGRLVLGQPTVRASVDQCGALR